jgi:hypothetical protein
MGRLKNAITASFAMKYGILPKNVYFLDPVNGISGGDGSIERPFLDLPTAEDVLRANQNDVLFIIGGATSLKLTEGFVWDKAYTHLIGLTQPAPYSRCRLQSNAIIPTLFTHSVNGCIFSGIHWQQGEGGDATSVNNVVVAATANQNFFENCHFDSPLLAAAGTGAYRILTLAGSGTTGARSNTFRNCWFGDWTAAPASADGEIVDIGDATAGTQFENCKFIINTTEATMVPIAAASDVGGGNPPGYIYFKDCEFLAMSTGVNVCFTAPTTGKIILSNCRSVGVTAWSATSTNIISTNNYLANDLAGLGVSITT